MRRWNETFGLQQRGVVVDENRETRLSTAPTESNVGATPWYENLPDTDPRKSLYRTDATRAPAAAAAEDSPLIDDQTLNDYADALATSGVFPNLGGFGKYGTKVKMQIGQRASQRHPGLNIARASADYKANQAALSKLTQTSAGLEAFSQTVRANADILLEEVNGIPEYGNRFMNSASRKAAAIMGDTSVARFNTALETVVPEFARILQSGGQITGAPLTDTQKKDMRAVLHGDFTRGQLRGSISILNREVANRKKAQENQIGALQRKIIPWGTTQADTTGESSGDPLDGFYR
jgi:hypothetical protein